jgi:hypothetical protein
MFIGKTPIIFQNCINSSGVQIPDTAIRGE